MNKKIYIFSSIYFILACADITITYLSTPNLFFEANPLVAVFKFGWSALIFSNLLGLLIYIFCCYYYFQRYQTINCKAENVGEYISQIMFDRQDKFLWIFYRVPKNWKPVKACLSYAFIWTFLFARMIALFEWYVWHSDTPLRNTYITFKETFAYERFDIIIITAFSFILVSHWFFKEYEKSEKEKVSCI